MPNARKCHTCRSSKVSCSRDGQIWNEQDPQTKCSRCKRMDLRCGPDEYKNENDQGEPEGIPAMGPGPRSGAPDIRGLQLLAPVPNELVYTEANLRRRLHRLGNSEVFHITRQTVSSVALQNYIVPEELRRALEDIERLADVAHASNEISIAEVAYTRLIDWYSDLGPEVKQLRQQLLMKVGGIYERTGWNDRAEHFYSKIFDDLLMADSDLNTPFHHAIRNFNTKGQFSQDALMRIIRCCPLCRFKLRNGEGQTPLYLAVSTAEECVVVAIMRRLKDPRRRPPIDSCHLDAKDCRGLDILTTAVLAQCSLPLVDALIKYGSNVNPQTWVGGPCTPLQAASIPGSERIDIAWLLIRHQANRDHVCPDSTIAKQMDNGLPEPEYIPLLLELDQPPDA